MKKNVITINQTIFITKPKEIVWNYTQNYNHRKIWDKSVLEAVVLQTKSYRIVMTRMKGNASMTLCYKLDDRPNKTTLVAKDIRSLIIERAGGSWSYEDINGGTLWTQKNTIELKRGILIKVFVGVFKFVLDSQTKKAMSTAKKTLEEA